MDWHSIEIEKVFEELKSSEKGLSEEEVKRRLEENGPNELKEKRKTPPWMIFLNQFKDFMIIVLVAAAVVSGFVGDLADTIIILVIVILNAVVGFIQEYRAEKALEALQKLAAPQAKLIRDGQRVVKPSAEIVQGDIVIIEAGDVVPADLRLIKSASLRIEESSLTGESVSIDKTTEPIKEAETSLGDRTNIAYKGTLVTNGRGRGLVIATGMNTEIGKIAGMLQENKLATPLQKRMTDFGRKLSYIIILICVLLFIVGLLRGEEPLKMLLVSISLAVAAIPEALPALITIALALGAKRMVKQNALIRKLPAVETLGSVTYICSDKTGTLTQNKMTVVKTALEQNEAFKPDKEISLFDLCLLLNHDVKKNKEGKWMGDPTEIALIEYVHKKYDEGKLKDIIKRFPRKAELPFDSDRKCMTTLHQFEEKCFVTTKGAVEVILSKLKDKGQDKEINDESIKMATEGIRVLSYGWKVLDHFPKDLKPEQIENDLSFAGLVGMIDPPREEVKPAIRECRTAGIHPVMITGDHKETAAAIARDIGILTSKGEAITGTELAKLSPEDLVERVEDIQVYARVSPQQKLDIVKALQKNKHFVAMTGDGVNDAPSLKAANIGVAMGINGTDVSKEAADMILLDDNFATIVKAVREGRRIYDNIRKFVKYIMTCNGAEIWTIFLAPLIGLPIPLLPIHILWINLVTDGLPGLALSAEDAEKDIMKRRPRRTDESLLSGGAGYHIIWVGLLMAFITLGIQAWAYHTDNAHWQTMVFTVLSLAQLGHVMAIRSESEFIYRKGFWTNLPLLGAVVLTFLLQLMVIYLPFFNEIFKTQPLSINELLICVGVSAIVFHAVELEKYIKLRLLTPKKQAPGGPNKPPK